MMDVPDDVMLFDFVPGSEEAVADFDCWVMWFSNVLSTEVKRPLPAALQNYLNFFLIHRLVLGVAFRSPTVYPYAFQQ